MILTNRFLNKLGTNIGEDLVIHDVAERKIYFIHHSNEEYRIKQIRGKRKRITKIRGTDKFFCVNADGSVSEELSDGFVRM